MVMTRACLEPARAPEAGRAGGCLHSGPPVPASPAAVREEGVLFRLRTNLLLQNAALLVRPQLAALGLNSFQSAACDMRRNAMGQPSSAKPADRRGRAPLRRGR